jgi:hypothetical protein
MTRAQQSLGQRDGPWRLEQLDSRIGWPSLGECQLSIIQLSAAGDQIGSMQEVGLDSQGLRRGLGRGPHSLGCWGQVPPRRTLPAARGNQQSSSLIWDLWILFLTEK